MSQTLGQSTHISFWCLQKRSKDKQDYLTYLSRSWEWGTLVCETEKSTWEERGCVSLLFSDSAFSGMLPAHLKSEAPIIVAEVRSRSIVIYWRKLHSCNKTETKRNKFQASMCPCGFWRNRLKDDVPNRNEVVWTLCFITPYCKNNLRISEFQTQASVTKTPEESEDSKNGESMVWWMWKESLCTKLILLT